MRLLLLACTPLFALACQSPAGIADSGPSALFERSTSAPVHIVSVGGSLVGSEEKYGLTAQKDANGEVSGHLVVRLLDHVVSFTGDVTCLQVQDNMAWIGVLITKSDATTGPMVEGRSFWFRVQDNGEGADAPVDRISSLNPGGGAARCNERRTGLSLAWEMQGNVQVR